MSHHRILLLLPDSLPGRDVEAVWGEGEGEADWLIDSMICLLFD